MLIRFRVRNFLSFKDEVEFSMNKGKTRQHKQHFVITGTRRHDIKILRAGVVYGANASGKTNLVSAIAFAQNFICEGFKPKQTIPVIPFRLDRACLQQPSKFEFEIRSGDRNYLYGFEVDSRQVHSEWLFELKKTNQAFIFERKSSNGDTTVEFGNIKSTGKDDINFLQYVARGTRSNQLFLRESIERNIPYFTAVYDWFDTVLRIVFPSSRYYIKLDEKKEEIKDIVEHLGLLDTGVCGFDLKLVSPEAEIPRDYFNEITKDLEPGLSLSLMKMDSGQRYWITKTDRMETTVYKLMLKHPMADCQETVSFETYDESEGTVRLLDLIPILTIPANKTHVYIVDELDRSLHPNLCYQVIEQFVSLPGNSQLVVTTHDSNLLTFDLLRRDEIWFVEKNAQGATSLYSLEEFTPRYDKDIEKGYLLGRFGAIPIISKKPFYTPE